uniref:Uncharacterized protein n=1 Tax=Leptocylindrus danicus TaxID=163516 RepID=A0A7S2K8Q3_9STRA
MDWRSAGEIIDEKDTCEYSSTIVIETSCQRLSKSSITLSIHFHQTRRSHVPYPLIVIVRSYVLYQYESSYADKKNCLRSSSLQLKIMIPPHHVPFFKSSL